MANYVVTLDGIAMARIVNETTLKVNVNTADGALTFASKRHEICERNLEMAKTVGEGEGIASANHALAEAIRAEMAALEVSMDAKNALSEYNKRSEESKNREAERTAERIIMERRLKDAESRQRSHRLAEREEEAAVNAAINAGVGKGKGGMRFKD